MIQSINPYDETVLETFQEHDDAAVDATLTRARTAQREWRRTSLTERQALLRRLASTLRAGKQEYASLITAEMGKPVTEAMAEVEKCAVNCDYYATEAERLLAPEVIASNATHSEVVFDPLGTVLAVMPWNYPFWQVMRFAAPALLAGNTAVLKHANNVPQCALALAKLFERADAPAGLFSTLLVNASRVQRLIADDRIAAVTFTGSTPVGRTIAAQAGAALKKQVLELGGSDPFIVLADADIDLAARTAVKARFHNAGQSCISAKRFIVEEGVADAFVEAFVTHTRALKMGDPRDTAVDVGPMARNNLRMELHAQVHASVDAGARLRLGGAPGEGKGYFYGPTVLDRVTPQMAAGRDETFGPAAAIIRCRDADDAIRIANDTVFGLGAAIWTGDVGRGQRLARDIEAGAVFVNGTVASDPRLPFGGIKQSGYGRELSSYGLKEFTNIKSVWTGPAR
ncbi:NAD-dependent succinate-semialdehyde dehydrogenase [Bordetella genomosp. 9]|uniref:NADP-dependent succinic semialdehyde dehydrogenase n=1 Tax=Bordetella genomosp. 9 TaxID=1416803 RepID=A0A1W6Z5L3_9BORD|nr:NAD-dependent succinate-semialdehyde dehydrogenase [Bordetella genomosp. 9]ARP88474.1 NADP-dependent succinic semialdehyde dehydrogenase [Bordetella genomosp. 9]